MTLSIERLRRSLLNQPIDSFTDLPLLQRAKQAMVANLKPADLRDAAVLIPLVERATGWQLVLTRRTDQLRNHAGQVSFPGGAADADDADAAATARREADEEIGVVPTSVQVIGYLPEHPVISGFSVTPVVAVVDPPDVYRPEPGEVAEVFEIPWAVVNDPRHQLIDRRMIAGAEREFYRLSYQEYDIWGATAGMLMDLVRHYELYR